MSGITLPSSLSPLQWKIVRDDSDHSHLFYSIHYSHSSTDSNSSNLLRDPRFKEILSTWKWLLHFVRNGILHFSAGRLYMMPFKIARCYSATWQLRPGQVRRTTPTILRPMTELQSVLDRNQYRVGETLQQHTHLKYIVFCKEPTMLFTKEQRDMAPFSLRDPIAILKLSIARPKYLKKKTHRNEVWQNFED